MNQHLNFHIHSIIQILLIHFHNIQIMLYEFYQIFHLVNLHKQHYFLLQ